MSHPLKSTRLVLYALVIAVSVAGCPGEEEPRDPCEGVVCGPGHCVESEGRAACECDPGHHAEGLTCVNDNEHPKNPCEPNPCMQPGREVCLAVDGQAVCGCNPGTVEGPGGTCVVPNPCEPNPCTQPNKTDCSVSGGQAVCSCVSGYVPEGDGCTPEQTVTCAGQHSTGDAFEPDECPALARGVGTGGTQDEAHTLSPVGDEDWFELTAVAGHVYEAVATGAAGERLDLDLYAADGTTVLASDHRGQAVARLLHKAVASGERFFRIRAFVRGESGAYSVSIVDLGADDFADEPELATALTAPSGTPVSGALQFDGDRDVVKLPLVAGHSYRFEAAWSASSTAPLQLELIAPDRTTVVVSSQQVAPRALTRITSAGDYYLRLQELTGTLRAGYTFTFTDLGVDDFGDVLSESSPVIVDAPPADGGFERPDDVDVLSFQAQAGHIYAFTCNPSGGATDCLVSLSDTAGNVLATDNNGGTGSIVHEYLQAGTYFFRLSSGAVGTYTYRLEDLGFDDHGDTRDTATSITPVATPTGARLEVPGDVDFLRLEVQPERVYSFTCVSAAFACAVELQDAAGTVLESGTASSDSVTLSHTFTAAASVYLRFASDTLGAMGSYTWLVESRDADDHGDTIETATPITPGGEARDGVLEEAGDVDVFRFNATAGHIYRFTCSSSTLDCDAELLDASGAVLVSATGPETPAIITFELETGGAYFFRVQTDGAAAGAYTYSLEDLGVDDHGDSAAAATPITPSTTSSTGRVETLGDVDFFSFSGEVNTTYEFSCSSAAIDCNAVLYDASGNVLRSDTGSSSSAQVTYVVRAAATFFVRVSSGTATSGVYTYQLKNLGVDDHGNTLSDATPVTPSTTATNAKIDATGDVDVFSFSAVAGHIYEVRCTTIAFDCNVVLMDAAGTVIGSDMSTAQSATVRLELNTAGTYYFRIQSGAATSGAYTYQLLDLGVDDHGDTMATATPIVSSTTSTSAQFEVAGDVDVFSFTAAAGHFFEFSCFPTSANCNVYLMDAAGTVLVSDTASTTYAVVRLELTTAGTYYVRVVAATWSTNTAYSYQLEDLGTDDHGDTLATATPIVPTTTSTTGHFESAGDADWFSFTAVAGHIYSFWCNPTGQDACSVSLVDAAGTVLVSDSSSTLAEVFRELSTGGTYYVRVVVSNWSGPTDYTYQLEDLGVDDHGDTLATATPIVPSTTSTPAVFELAGDVDWFSFTAQAGHIYDFVCSPSVINCDVYLTDAAGTVLVSDTASTRTARVRWRIATAGTYYLRVVAADWISFNTYSYQLQDLGVDDHADSTVGATVLPLGTSVAGGIQFDGDVDFFAVTLSSSTSYTVSATGSFISLIVYAPDGTTVLSNGDSPRTFTSVVGGGTHYVRVSSSIGTNTYTVRVQ